MSNSITNNSTGNVWSSTFCFLLIAAIAMFPDVAAATGVDASDNNLTQVICNVIILLQGNIARGVAAFGIIFLGFSLFLGKISWGTAFALAIGLGAIFGAQALVNLMTGDTDQLECTEQTNVTGGGEQ